MFTTMCFVLPAPLYKQRVAKESYDMDKKNDINIKLLNIIVHSCPGFKGTAIEVTAFIE